MINCEHLLARYTGRGIQRKCYDCGQFIKGTHSALVVHTIGERPC